jgi:hypothetical protein
MAVAFARVWPRAAPLFSKVLAKVFSKVSAKVWTKVLAKVWTPAMADVGRLVAVARQPSPSAPFRAAPRAA